MKLHFNKYFKFYSFFYHFHKLAWVSIYNGYMLALTNPVKQLAWNLHQYKKWIIVDNHTWFGTNDILRSLHISCINIEMMLVTLGEYSLHLDSLNLSLHYSSFDDTIHLSLQSSLDEIIHLSLLQYLGWGDTSKFTKAWLENNTQSA